MPKSLILRFAFFTGILILGSCAQNSANQPTKVAYLPADSNSNRGPAIRISEFSRRSQPTTAHSAPTAQATNTAEPVTRAVPSQETSWTRANLSPKQYATSAQLLEPQAAPSADLASHIRKVEFWLEKGESYSNALARLQVEAMIGNEMVRWHITSFRREETGMHYGRAISDDSEYDLVFRCRDSGCSTSSLEITDRESDAYATVTATRRTERASFTPAAIQRGRELKPRDNREAALFEAIRRNTPVQRTEIEVDGGRTFTQVEIDSQDANESATTESQDQRWVLEQDVDSNPQRGDGVSDEELARVRPRARPTRPAVTRAAKDDLVTPAPPSRPRTQGIKDTEDRRTEMIANRKAPLQVPPERPHTPTPRHRSAGPAHDVPPAPLQAPGALPAPPKIPAPLAPVETPRTPPPLIPPEASGEENKDDRMPTEPAQIDESSVAFVEITPDDTRDLETSAPPEPRPEEMIGPPMERPKDFKVAKPAPAPATPSAQRPRPVIEDDGSVDFAWPVQKVRITSLWGDRRGHKGLDLDGETGDPILAAESGVVVSVGWQNGYGKTVMIEHGDNWTTLYAHLSSAKVSVGQRVAKGERIAAMGSTGRSTGSHLHFEIQERRRPLNPIAHLPSASGHRVASK